MSQRSLFDPGPSGPQVLDLPDASIELWPESLPAAEADRLLASLTDGLEWRQDSTYVYGTLHAIPRLQAWYGDPGCSYAYSGIRMDPLPWHPDLAAVRHRLEALAGAPFNSVLCNLYRDGRDSVGWHSDDEPELGPEPVIASVSLGETRRFQLRHRSVDDLRAELLLEHGSVVVMRGPTQRHWRHQVPKGPAGLGPRINLTYRLVAPPAG